MTGKSHIADFPPADRELLASLPYRVGIWMSQAEDEGGERDDAREMKALEKIFTLLAKEERTPVFVRELLQETLSRRDRWPEWQENSLDILPDCARAINILEAHAGKTDRNNFRRALKKIAASVAGAHGEFGFEAESAGGGMLARLSGLLGAGKEKSPDFMNISAAEQDVMRNLVNALRASDDK